MSAVLDDVALEGAPELASLLSESVGTEREGPVVLALDIGTSGARAALFDIRGEEIQGSRVSLSNDLCPEFASGADTDADALVDFVGRALDLGITHAESFVSRIDYVAGSCFWQSLMGVDDRGRAVTPLLGWADARAADAVKELQSKFDERKFHLRTGARFHPSYWPAKLLWLRSDRGKLFDKATRWLSFSDYLYLQLFDETMTSVSMASATGLFDQSTCEWNGELLEALGISPRQLPPIGLPGKTFQQLSEEYALRWPLLDGAAWFPAIGDGAANNIGSGCVTRNRAALMIGTSGAMRVLFFGPPPKSLPPDLFSYRADRDRVVIGGALSDGGGLYRWMKNSLALDYDGEELEGKLAAMEPDSHGLTVLPFWSGERAPGWKASAHGAILGLTATTKPIEILRAAMESICYRFALLARVLDNIAPNTTIVASGNALLASRVWAQMITDVLGQPIELSSTREASCRGAALLALETIGKIDSIETLSAGLDEVLEPDMTRHAIYARAIERQQQLYEKLN